MQNLIGSMSPNQLMQLIAGMGENSELGGASGLLAQLSQIAPGLGGRTGGGGSGGGPATATKGPSAPKPESLLKEVKGGAKASSQGTSKAPAAGSTSNAIQLQDLQHILSNIQPTNAVQGKHKSQLIEYLIFRDAANTGTIRLSGYSAKGIYALLSQFKKTPM